MRQVDFHEVIPAIPVPYQCVSIDEDIVQAVVPEEFSEPATGIGAFDVEVHEAIYITSTPG